MFRVLQEGEGDYQTQQPRRPSQDNSLLMMHNNAGIES